LEAVRLQSYLLVYLVVYLRLLEGVDVLLSKEASARHLG